MSASDFKFQLRLLWARTGYRPTQRLLHRLNLHYAPPGPQMPGQIGRQHWCQWCGLRGDVVTFKDLVRASSIEEAGEPEAVKRGSA